jgi:hypothetical protein
MNFALATPVFVAPPRSSLSGGGTVERECDAAKIKATANRGKAKLTCHAPRRGSDHGGVRGP